MIFKPAFDIEYTAGKFPPAYDFPSSLPPAPVDKRYFSLVNKAAGQYFEPQAAMSRSGTTKISLKFYISETESNSQLLQWGKLLVRIVNQTTIYVWLDTSFDFVSFTVPSLGGFLNEFSLEFSSGSTLVSMVLNGVSYSDNTVKDYDPFQGYRYFFARWLGVYFSGIVADVLINYNGVDEHFWPLSFLPGTTDEVDSISSLQMSIINIPAADTTEYTKNNITWSNGVLDFDEAF